MQDRHRYKTYKVCNNNKLNNTDSLTRGLSLFFTSYLSQLVFSDIGQPFNHTGRYKIIRNVRGPAEKDSDGTRVGNPTAGLAVRGCTGNVIFA
jgi:hypothetical protein